MKNLIKILASSALASLLSVQAFAAFNLSVTGDTVISGSVNKGRYVARGVSVNADYQMMPEIPVSLGVTGAFKNTSQGNQNEFAPTAKFWLSSEITGMSALQPFIRGGYAFSWISPAAGAQNPRNGTNHGLMLNVGNNFAITETVSAIAAYNFHVRNNTVAGSNNELMSHGASIGFSAEMF